MQVYQAPLRDMRFVLHELFDEKEFGGIEAWQEAIRIPVPAPEAEPATTFSAEPGR